MSKLLITDQKKEEIRDVADIVDVVSDYVKLRRAGSGFTGLCPFHNEKTPSFHVTPRLGIFKCFGCGAGGDVFNFVMQMEGVGFMEAMRTLADRYNIELPQEENPEYDARTQLTEGIYHALRFAGVFYHQQLMGEDAGEKARNYLLKRGLKIPTIKKYGLGFSPDSMDSLYKQAIDQGINEMYLAEAGLIKYSENTQRPYDVFRGRLMFPIFSTSGKVIAFGGRIMEKDGGPKYINSPQTKVYNKSEVIYGIHLAKNEIRKADQAILVEGYMDVISMWQHDVKNVVATSGTSVTDGQMRLLRNYSENMLMVYDADNAGQNAMIRGLDVALSQGLSVQLMHLPEGEDPDSFVQKFGSESFREYSREHAKDFITFMVQRAEELQQWDDPNQRRKVITDILKSVSIISDLVMQETLVRQLRKLSGVGDKALFDELGKHIAARKNEMMRDQQRQRLRDERQSVEPIPAPTESQPPGSITYGGPQPTVRKRPKKRPNYEKEIIRLMVEHGDDMVFYIGNLINDEHFEDEDLRIFFQDIIQRYSEEKEISVEAYTERDHPFPALLGEILIERHAVSERGNQKRTTKIMKDADPFATARGALKRIKIAFLQRKRDEIIDRTTSENEEERTVMLQKLTEVRKSLLRFEQINAEELFPSLDDLLKQVN